MGISLGGVFATATALRHTELVDGLILSAPAFASTIKVPLTQRLRVLRRSFTEPTRLYDLPFGPRDITANEDWLAVIENDERRTSKVSARFLTSIFKCQAWVKKEIARLDIPTYCMLAEDDAVIDNRGVTRILDRAEGAGACIETFVGATHILPASVPREELLSRLVGWIKGPPFPESSRDRHVSTAIPGGEIAAAPDLTETSA